MRREIKERVREGKRRSESKRETGNQLEVDNYRER